jgi:hypothetical protein
MKAKLQPEAMTLKAKRIWAGILRRKMKPKVEDASDFSASFAALLPRKIFTRTPKIIRIPPSVTNGKVKPPTFQNINFIYFILLSLDAHPRGLISISIAKRCKSQPTTKST